MTTIPLRDEQPTDPRGAWTGLPAPGTMPRVTQIESTLVRVIAPNPSPMTLDGTNTYVLSPTGSGDAVVVDPGPRSEEHLARVRGVLQDHDATLAAVLVTHHHQDHAEAAGMLARSVGCRVFAADPEVAGPDGRVIGDGSRVSIGSTRLEIIATPGHTRDHLSFRVPSGAVLTGDHVLGRGTTVIAHPDGDLDAYLDSLLRLERLGGPPLYPGHGPALLEDPGAVLSYYRRHRAYRQAQVLAVLREGPARPADVVARIYADVEPSLWMAAEASTRAVLSSLEASGRARTDDAGRSVIVEAESG